MPHSTKLLTALLLLTAMLACSSNFGPEPTPVVIIATPTAAQNSQPQPPPPTEEPAPPPAPKADTRLFWDDFEYGLKPEWEQHLGQWRMADGHLQAVEFVDRVAKIFVGNSTWRNYTVALDVGGLRNEEWLGINGIAVYVRAQDPHNLLWFQVNGKVARCGITKNGEDDLISEKEMVMSQGRLRVRAYEDSFEFWVNDQKICVLQDTTLSHGQVGVWSYKYQQVGPAWVDNLVIEAIK